MPAPTRLRSTRTATLPRCAARHDCWPACWTPNSDLHIAYCAEWGLSEDDLAREPESLELLAYTRTMLDYGQSGDILDLMVSLSACLIGYAEVGLRLLADPATRLDGNPYLPVDRGLWRRALRGPRQRGRATARRPRCIARRRRTLCDAAALLQNNREVGSGILDAWHPRCGQSLVRASPDLRILRRRGPQKITQVAKCSEKFFETMCGDPASTKMTSWAAKTAPLRHLLTKSPDPLNARCRARPAYAGLGYPRRIGAYSPTFIEPCLSPYQNLNSLRGAGEVRPAPLSSENDPVVRLAIGPPSGPSPCTRAGVRLERTMHDQRVHFAMDGMVEGMPGNAPDEQAKPIAMSRDRMARRLVPITKLNCIALKPRACAWAIECSSHRECATLDVPMRQARSCSRSCRHGSRVRRWFARM